MKEESTTFSYLISILCHRLLITVSFLEIWRGQAHLTPTIVLWTSSTRYGAPANDELRLHLVIDCESQ